MAQPTTDGFDTLQVGHKATIVGYGDMPAGYRKKLMSMGLTPGTQFEIVRKAPMGDPVEICVRGFSMGLRQSEAAELIIEKL